MLQHIFIRFLLLTIAHEDKLQPDTPQPLLATAVCHKMSIALALTTIALFYTNKGGSRAVTSGSDRQQ